MRRRLNTLERQHLGEYVQLTEEFRYKNTYLKIHNPPHSKILRILAYQFKFPREITAIYSENQTTHINTYTVCMECLIVTTAGEYGNQYGLTL